MGNISVWIFLLLELFVNILSTRFCSESVLETKTYQAIIHGGGEGAKEVFLLSQHILQPPHLHQV
jgi:hypothetical protein